MRFEYVAISIAPFHQLFQLQDNKHSANVGECSLNVFGVKDDSITMVMPVSKGDNLGLYDDDILHKPVNRLQRHLEQPLCKVPEKILNVVLNDAGETVVKDTGLPFSSSNNDPALCVFFAFGAYLLTNVNIGKENRLFTNTYIFFILLSRELFRHRFPINGSFFNTV